MSVGDSGADKKRDLREFDDPKVRKFLRRRSRQNSESAVKTDKTVMRQYLDHLDGIPVEEGTYTDVVRYADKVVERGCPISTLRVYISSISCLNDYLNYHHQENMPSVSRIPKQYHDVKKSYEREDLDRKEVKALIEATDSLRDALVIALIYFSGMRSSECSNLKLTDLDLEADRFEVVNAKYDGERWLPIHENVQFILERWLDEARASYPMAPESEYLFVGDESEQLSVENIWQIVHDAADDAGIQCVERERADGANIYRVKTHVLRHSLATHAFEDGMTLEELAALLGHDDIDSVRTYVHTHAQEKAIKSFKDNVDSL